MSYNNRNQPNLNPNIWDLPVSNQFSQQNPPFIHQTFGRSPTSNINFQNQNNQHFFQSQHNQYQPHGSHMGNGSFNSDSDRSYNNPPYKNFKNNRGNRPGPAFSKRPAVRDNEPNRSIKSFQNNNNFDSFPKHDTDLRIKPPSPKPDQPVTLLGTLARLKSKKDANSVDELCEKRAPEVSKNLISKINTMKPGDTKSLINNPQPHTKKFLNIQAKQNIRQQNRQMLTSLGREGDIEDLQADEAVDIQDMPDNFIAELTKNFEMDDEHQTNDENNEVLKNNLGTNFLKGSEFLLMSGFSLLGDNEEPQFDVPKIPPLPIDKIKPPPPDEIPVPPRALSPQSDPRNETLPEGCVSFYGNVRNWDIDMESSKNPDPPSSAIEQTKLKEEKSIEVCDYTLGLRPTYSPKYEELNKHIQQIQSITTTATSSTPLYGMNKLVKPSNPTQSNIIPIPPSPVCSESVTIPPSPFQSETNVPPPEIVPPPQIPKVVEQSSSSETPSQTISKEVQPVASETIQKTTPSTQPSEEVQKTTESKDSERRAGETYGDYRRRMQDEEKKKLDEERDKSNTEDKTSQGPSNNNIPRVKGPQCVQNKPRDRNWKKNNRWGHNVSGNNQVQGRNQHQTFNNDNRKSRAEMDRGRDNWLTQSRTNDSHSKELPDAHNYRFTSETNPEKLANILTPKPLNLNKSFNKRTRDRSPVVYGREPTPVNTSPDRSFDESSYVPANDLRPCYYTLKKIMEMDEEISKIHDKIHGIDKVIQNLQSDRVSQQKNFNRLQHDRKVLFENLMKRASSNEKRNPSPTATATATTSSKVDKEKRLQTLTDQKKRKHGEVSEEIVRKKQATEVVVESASAYEKAEKLKKENEEKRKAEEEERKRIREVEKRKEKKQRQREKAENDRRELEEKIRQEEIAKTKVIKQEPKERRDKSSKEKSREKSVDILASFDHLVRDISEMKECTVKLDRLEVQQSSVDEYEKFKFAIIHLDQLNGTPAETNETPEIVERPKSVMSNEIMSKPVTPDIEEIREDFDPLGIDKSEYSDWSGNFTSHESQIMHIQVVLECFLLAGCHDGKVLKYDINNGDLLNVSNEHKQICNGVLYDDLNSVFSVSSDKFMNQINLETFELISFVDFAEELQVIVKSKTSLFIGSKEGNIFKLKNDLIQKPAEPLCSTGSMIFCIKAMKEGPRNILLVSSKSNGNIQIRDADDGLLLRELVGQQNPLNIYDMLVDGGTIYCGTSTNNIYAVDFTDGSLKRTLRSGKGAICLRMYDDYLIAACYDGNIYIINTKDENDSTNICSPSDRLLSIELWDNKIVATTNDKTLKIINIPSLL